MARHAVVRQIFLERFSELFETVDDHRLQEWLVAKITSALLYRISHKIHIELARCLNFKHLQPASFDKV